MTEFHAFPNNAMEHCGLKFMCKPCDWYCRLSVHLPIPYAMENHHRELADSVVTLSNGALDRIANSD